VKKLAAHRRSPIAVVVMLLLGLSMTGTAYAVMKPSTEPVPSASVSVDDVEAGKELFLANCASCHGQTGQGNPPAGPSLVGVGAAAVDFQVGTGRMPMAAPGVQAPDKGVHFDQEEIDQLAAFVDSLGGGPAVPDEEFTDLEGANIANGGKIFRTNCAMCHNSSGTGGALTRGKYAPSLVGVAEAHIYEAMLTGPQSMPVFNDHNLTPQEKEDVIAFLKDIETGGNSYGGHSMGSIGPAGDALFIWTFGVALMIGLAVWLGRKAA
jgi:ubiquinol-cytochrome c reductase cytochrome c subunit